MVAVNLCPILTGGCEAASQLTDQSSVVAVKLKVNFQPCLLRSVILLPPKQNRSTTYIH